VLIGQLGINVNYRNMSIGSQTINFYERNGFIQLYSSEQEEREAFMLPSSVSHRTRMMYCDLKLWLQTR